MRSLVTACLAAILALYAHPAAHAAGVRGTVFGPGDRLLSGVRVTLSGATVSTLEVSTDAAGRYRFEKLRPGRYWVLVGIAGFASQRQPVALAGPNQVLGISFRLQPWSEIPWSITGTVTGEEDGRPIAGAKVALTREAMPGRREEAGDTATDNAGFYAFTGLKAGRYSVSVAAPRRLPGSQSDVVLLREADRPTADIRLFQPPKEQLPGSVDLDLLGADGQPLANAEVQIAITGEGTHTPLTWGEELQNRQWRNQEIRDDRMTMSIRGAATTDAAGRIHFTLPAGTWRIRVVGKGVLSPVQEVGVPPDGLAHPAPFRMAQGEEPAEPQRPAAQAPPAGRLRGVVLKPDGTPLANCGIYLFVARVRGEGGSWDDETGDIVEAYTTTDALGAFERGALAPGHVMAAVKTRGYSESEPARAVVPKEGAAEVTLRLPGPSARAAGRVTDGEGKPLAGARVYAHRLLGRWRDSHFWQSLDHPWLGGRQQDGGPWPFDTPVEGLKPGVIPGLLQHGISYAETDADGRFTLPDLDAAVYHFGTTAPGRSHALRERIALQAGGEPPLLEFTLGKLGAIEGLALLPDGRPAARVGIRIGCSRAGDEDGRAAVKRATTGSDGRYRLEGLEPGSYRFRVKATGYRSIELARVVVRAGEVTPGGDIRLDQGLPLRGRVLKPDGAPAADALVSCYIRQGGYQEMLTVASNADGSFAFTGLPAGSGPCSARLAPHAPVLTQVSLPQDPGAALELRLAAGATVRGTLRDEEGVPIADAYVHWYRVPPLELGGGYEPQRTDAAGQFTLTGIPAGTILLHASKLPYRQTQETREIAPGAELKLELTMARLRYGDLRGRLVRSDGAPAAGINVQANTRGATQVRVTTDAAGTFRMVHIAAGEVTVTPEAPLAAGQKLLYRVNPDEETVLPDIRLAEAGDIECTIHGLVKAPGDDRAMLMALVEAQSADGQAAPASGATRLYIRSDGTVRVDPAEAPVPAGSVGTLAYGTGGTIYLLYRPGTRLGFDLFSAARPPIAPVAEGVVTLRQVPVGRCRVGLALPCGPEGMVIAPGTAVTVAAGQTARADITVVPGGKLAGRLTPASEAGSGGTPQVWVFRSETLDLAGLATPRPDGSFRLDGLAPGDYAVYLWPSRCAGIRESFTIRPGETTELAPALAKGVALRGRLEGTHPKGMLLCAESDRSFGAGQVADDGTFTIEHLLPGKYAVCLWVPGQEKVARLMGVTVGEAGTEGVVLKWK